MSVQSFLLLSLTLSQKLSSSALEIYCFELIRTRNILEVIKARKYTVMNDGIARGTSFLAPLLTARHCLKELRGGSGHETAMIWSAPFSAIARKSSGSPFPSDSSLIAHVFKSMEAKRWHWMRAGTQATPLTTSLLLVIRITHFYNTRFPGLTSASLVNQGMCRLVQNRSTGVNVTHPKAYGYSFRTTVWIDAYFLTCMSSQHKGCFY
jgi:hypothetical protein